MSLQFKTLVIPVIDITSCIGYSDIASAFANIGTLSSIEIVRWTGDPYLAIPQKDEDGNYIHATAYVVIKDWTMSEESRQFRKDLSLGRATIDIINHRHLVGGNNGVIHFRDGLTPIYIHIQQEKKHNLEHCTIRF
jgi:hypothetical protein